MCNILKYIYFESHVAILWYYSFTAILNLDSDFGLFD